MTFPTRRTPCVLLWFVLLAVLCASHRAFGGAYEWGGLGSRALSMGGAFIGLADDWTALYWNPAGLTQLEGTHVGFDFLSPHPKLTDGSSLSNLLPPLMDTRYQRDVFAQYPPGLEPTRFNKQTVKYHFYVPAGAGICWEYAGLNMATGYYIPVGYYVDWDDSLAYGAGSIRAKLFQELRVFTANFSVGKQINPSLSLGAGLDVLFGAVDYEAWKVVAGSGISDYSWGIQSDSEGTGYEGTFGVLYKATRKLSVGGVYRTGATIGLKGDAQTFLTLMGLSEASGFVQYFDHPATYGVGLAYRCRPDLTLTADWQGTDWSEFDIDVEYTTPGVALTNREYSADWHDSNRYRFGAEWAACERWVLRSGYFFDESPLPDKSVSLSHIVDVDRHNVMFGVGHEFRRGWFVDLMLAYAQGDRSVAGVNYEQEAYAFGVSLSHKF